MLTTMTVVVKYEIYVQKYVVADNNDDSSDIGYDTQRQKVDDEVSKLLDKKINKLGELLPVGYRFHWEGESSIDEV